MHLASLHRSGKKTHDKIARRQLRKHLPETRTHTPLDTIAIDRARQQTLADHKSQPGMSERVGMRHDQEGIATRALIVCEHPLEFSRCPEARVTKNQCFPGRSDRVDQTARRARPFARRALMTARPALVFMRARNPWVRLRRTVDG